MNLERTHDGGDIAILIPCTESKADSPGPAIEVYFPTGVIASVKSAIANDEYDTGIDTYFLSARHGVIPLDQEIEPYDETIEEDDMEFLINAVGTFLEENDYKVMFSFVDRIYRKAVGEVAYSRQTQWDIDTLMFRPSGRTARFDGAQMLSAIIRKSTDISSAAEVTW